MVLVVADAALAVQKALIGVLATALPCPVYDAVPDHASYPYVSISSTDSAHEDRLNHAIERRVVVLNVWSQAKGQAEVLGILTQIHTVLHRSRLGLDDGRVVGCYISRKTTNLDADGETYQGQLIVELLVDVD